MGLFLFVLLFILKGRGGLITISDVDVFSLLCDNRVHLHTCEYARAWNAHAYRMCMNIYYPAIL